MSTYKDQLASIRIQNRLALRAAKERAQAYAREGKRLAAARASRERVADEWLQRMQTQQRRDRLGSIEDGPPEMTRTLCLFRMTEAFKQNIIDLLADDAYPVTVYLSPSQFLKMINISDIPVQYQLRLMPEVIKQNWTKYRAPATSWGSWELDKDV